MIRYGRQLEKPKYLSISTFYSLPGVNQFNSVAITAVKSDKDDTKNGAYSSKGTFYWPISLL